MTEAEHNSDQGLPHSVPLVSCERCKRRKSRCDRAFPICTGCARAQVACHYGTRKKPGFPAGHRQGLEGKIKRLENALAHAREGQSPVTTQPIQESLDHGATIDNVQNLDFSAVPEHEEQVQRPRPVELPHFSSTEQFGATAKRTRQIPESQPPLDLVVSLTSLYFRHIHPWFPFLDPHRVMSDLGALDDGTLLHQALFGVSLPFSYDSRLTKQSSDSFWKHTKRQILLEILEEPSCTALEALTILLLDLSSMTNGAQVWGALTVATRLAVQLKSSGPGILRLSSRTPAEGLENIDSIFRHRLFWAIFAIDCYVSITTRHPSGLSDETIEHFSTARVWAWKEQATQSLYGAGAFPRSNGTIGLTSLSPQIVFCHQLEILIISRHIHTAYIVYSSMTDLDNLVEWRQRIMMCSQTLSRWKSDLPESLHLSSLRAISAINSRVLPAFIMLHIYYSALMVFPHGLDSFPGSSMQEGQSLHSQTEARGVCSGSIEVIFNLVSHVHDKVGFQMGWPIAWSLWVALRHLFICEHQGVPLPADWTTTLLECLEKLGKTWQIAAKYARLLKHARLMIQQRSEEPSPLLLGMLDLRMSTSDLEDQFRVDSVLCTGPVDGISVATGVENLVNTGPPTIYEDGETWYTLPLFGSSGFHQYDSVPWTDSNNVFMMYN